MPLSVFGALLAAMLLNQGLRGTTFYRTLFFLPHLTPLVAALHLDLAAQPEVRPLNEVAASGCSGIDPGPGWFAQPGLGDAGADR